MNQSPRPKVGVTAMLTHNQRLLVGTRKGSHAAGQLAFPGGHQEWMKSWGETAVNETLEETGLSVRVNRQPDQSEYLFVTDNRMPHYDRHYTTIWVPCILDERHADIDLDKQIDPLEPDKCEGWNWLTFDSLFQKLFGRQDYTFEDIENQHPEQADWLPIKQLLRYHHALRLEWPLCLHEHGPHRYRT